MKNKKPILVVAVVLAVASFAYARHHYMNRNSATLTNPFNSGQHTTLTNPFADKALFGDWIKEEIPFAVVVPTLLLTLGGFALFRK